MKSDKHDLVADSHTGQISRRGLLWGAGVAATGLVGLAAARRAWQARSPVFLARHQHYHGPLARTIRDGLTAVGFDPKGARGLICPMFVPITQDSRWSRLLKPRLRAFC